MENNKRNSTIDVIKGWAIVFVVYGHVIQILYSGTDMNFFDDIIEKIICSFHMPLFAAVSGFLFYGSCSRKSLKKLFFNRLVGLGWPLILWSSVYYFGYQALLKIVSGAVNISFYDWWETFSGPFLWFLWSILICSVFMAIAYKTGKYKIIFSVLLFFPVFLLPNAEYTAFLYPFFTAGFFFREKESLFKKLMNCKVIYITIALYVVFLLFYKEKHYIYTTGINIFNSQYSWFEQLLIDLYRYAIGFLGTASVIIVIQKTICYYPASVNRFLSFCGKKSLEIYIIQCIAVSWLFALVFSRFITSGIGAGFAEIITNKFVLDLVMAPVVTVIFMIFISLLAMLIGKSKSINKLLFFR